MDEGCNPKDTADTGACYTNGDSAASWNSRILKETQGENRWRFLCSSGLELAYAFQILILHLTFEYRSTYSAKVGCFEERWLRVE